MIDLHSHILPELDDGSQNLRQSLEMARLALSGGITAMVATPHCSGDRVREVLEAVQLLRQALQEMDIPLKLYPGMEVFGTPDTARLLAEGRLLTLNDSRYPLIEFPFDTNGETETRILRDVLRAGFRPLVAHPERYGCIQRNPALADRWIKMGCLFQVNRGSLLGRFGPGAQRMAVQLTERGFASVVASDAHSHRVRTPWMEDIYSILSRELSPMAARYLLEDNPRRILKNEDLPPVEPEWFE